MKELPERFQVELISDDLLTNILLVANILVTLAISFFAGRYIQKKIKEYEVKAHAEKIITDRKIDFCLNIYKTFKNICIKDPISIEDNDIIQINKIKISENNLFLNQPIITRIENFGDYLINLAQGETKKDLEAEKFFFYKLKEYLNN